MRKKKHHSPQKYTKFRRCTLVRRTESGDDVRVSPTP
jgi:hypothetical protein